MLSTSLLCLIAEYWTTIEALEAMQTRIQDVNVKSSYDDTRSMLHALVRREILRKQVQTLTSILKTATANSRYSTKDIKRVAALNVPALKGIVSCEEGVPADGHSDTETQLGQ